MDQGALPEDDDKCMQPPVDSTTGLACPDLHRFAHWIDHTLAAEDGPVALKLLRALHWLNMVERGCLDQITGEGADEILEALVKSSAEKLPALPTNLEKPSGFGRLFLRLLVLEHARTVTVADQDVRSAHRWRILAAAFRFARSSGCTPALREGLTCVKFADIEKSFGLLPPGAE